MVVIAVKSSSSPRGILLQWVHKLL